MARIANDLRGGAELPKNKLGPRLAMRLVMRHPLHWLPLLALSLPACGSDPGATNDEPVLVERDAAQSADTSSTTPDTGGAQPEADTGEPTSPTADSAAAETAVDTGPPASTAKVPADLLDLKNWKLTLPIDTSGPGSPDEIKQPALDSFTHAEYFHLNDDKTGVLFRAHCGGATTSGSGYPRSELREMTKDGTANAAWSPSSGTHKMIVKEAITHLPVAKPDVVAAQIHDSEDDVIEIRLRDKLLFVEHDGANYGTLDAAYVVGTAYTVEIRVTSGKLEVFYNGVRKVERTASGSGYYFKAGAYTQSNPSKGDAATAYGEVVIYDLKVTHE